MNANRSHLIDTQSRADESRGSLAYGSSRPEWDLRDSSKLLRWAPRALGAAVFLFAGAVGSPAADWSQFRGPHANGVALETNIATRFEQPAWTCQLPGRGISSPIVLGDRVFVTAASGPRQDRLHVLCFNTRDGSLTWERRFWATGRTQCHEKTSVATPTPTSDGTHLYLTFSSNDIICLDQDGNLIWLRGITLDYPNVSNSLGMASSLLIAGNTLVVMVENDSESFTVGLDLADGVNRWKLNRPKMANWTSPVPLPAVSGSPVAGIQSGEGLLAVNADTGQTLWEYTEGAATIPSSVVMDDVLYVPSHGLTALRLNPSGDPPERLWRSGQLRPATASPIVVADRAFVINAAGVLTCGATSDGSRLWQLRLKGPFSASPVASGRHLYCINEEGLLHIVDCLAEEGEILGTYDLAETILSTPALARGALYVRSDRRLWKLN